MRADRTIRFAVLALVALASGCSSFENFLSGDKIDYRAAAAKTQPLEIPPDLTQLSRDARFQPQAGAISASSYAQAASGPATQVAVATQTVAPNAIGDVRIERDGNTRWLYTPQTPEQLWPQLEAFWQQNGFTLAVDDRESGTMETEWAENRARLPQDGVRAMLGKMLDTLYSTGQRDRYRMRVDRSPKGGSEISISHRGMVEVYTNQFQDQTKWQPRPSEPELEAVLLSRLLVKLGTPPEAAPQTAGAASAPGAATAVAAAPAVPARARILDGQAAVQIDDGFDRAWRRVGAALDRSGFTVEDRDRAGGLYFVRYVRPEDAGKEEPGFFARLFGNKDGPLGPARYRIALQREGDTQTKLSVLNAQGAPEQGEAGKRIVGLLIDDLR